MEYTTTRKRILRRNGRHNFMKIRSNRRIFWVYIYADRARRIARFYVINLYDLIIHGRPYSVGIVVIHGVN